MISSIWRHTLLTVPGVGASLLPKLVCPLCWPAHAGIVSSLGLGFLIGSAYLLPVTAAFLGVSAGALGFRARRRRGYGPLWMGLAAAVLVLAGRFQLESVVTIYAGVTLLVLASIWNIWPRRMIHVSRPSTIERTTYLVGHRKGVHREAQN